MAGDPDRDPRGHNVSIVYSVMVDPEAQVAAGDDAASAKWYDLDAVSSDQSTHEFAFDHKKILKEFL